MIEIGVVGLGPHWEQHYEPALRRLGRRIAVRAVFDPVFSRAEQVAAEWNAVPSQGLVSLGERADLRAFLVLDLGWQGWEALRILCSQAKPLCIVPRLPLQVEQLQELSELADAAGLTIMPGLTQRYTPATVRLRELMATQLGHPTSIVIEATIAGKPAVPNDRPFDADEQLLAKLLDWCRYVVNARPLRLAAHSGDSQQDPPEWQQTITISYQSPRTAAVATRAELRLRRHREGNAIGQAAVAEDEKIQFTVACRHGTATITSPLDISWTAGRQEYGECLAAERSEFDVLLDHFCRRVVGGLIPVAGLSDVLQSALLLEATRRSLQTGKAVDLNGRIENAT